MKRVTLLLGTVLLVSACGGGGPGEATGPVEDGDTMTTSSPVTVATASAPDPAGDELDLVTYVAAIEDSLAGTKYEGEAYEAPEIFLATGALFCEQLDTGVTPDGVVTGYIETLTGSSIAEAADDELVMAGGVLGVGVATLCPQHMGTVAGSR